MAIAARALAVRVAQRIRARVAHLLPKPDVAIAARSELAGASWPIGAQVAIEAVAIVAALHTGPHEAIAAPRELAGAARTIGARVGVVVVAVVALLTRLDDAVTADSRHLQLTRRRAAVTILIIAVIALFAAVHAAVAALLDLARGVATITVVSVAVVALLTDFLDAVATDRATAGAAADVPAAVGVAGQQARGLADRDAVLSAEVVPVADLVLRVTLLALSRPVAARRASADVVGAAHWIAAQRAPGEAQDGARVAAHVAAVALLALVDDPVPAAGRTAVGTAGAGAGVAVLGAVVALLAEVQHAVPADSDVRIVDVGVAVSVVAVVESLGLWRLASDEEQRARDGQMSLHIDPPVTVVVAGGITLSIVYCKKCNTTTLAQLPTRIGTVLAPCTPLEVPPRSASVNSDRPPQ